MFLVLERGLLFCVKLIRHNRQFSHLIMILLFCKFIAHILTINTVDLGFKVNLKRMFGHCVVHGI